MVFGGTHEFVKERMWPFWPREPFRVKLRGDVKRMGWVIEDLHNLTIGGHTTKDESCVFQPRFKGVVEFIAMAEAFVDDVFAVDFVDPRSWGQQHVMPTEPLGASQVTDVFLLG